MTSGAEPTKDLTDPMMPAAVGNGLVNSSPVGRLLEEMSWEGNAIPYRQGGRGRENVLTVEVFSILDLLPRGRFLGGVLAAAHGAEANRNRVIVNCEELTFSVLPGDIRPALADGSLAPWTVQPDVLLEDQEICCMVEAKRIRPSRFQRHQLARTLLALQHQARGRTPMLLLVLGKPPPITVAGLGRVELDQAIEDGTSMLDARDRIDANTLAQQAMSWITWHGLGQEVQEAHDAGPQPDPSVEGSLARMANALTRAINWHT